MKSTLDDAGPNAPTTDADTDERPRVPGGKVLARLLQVLESAGHEEAAAEAIETAIPDGERGEVTETMTRYTAAPSGIPGAPPEEPRPARGKAAPKARGRWSEEGAADAETAGAAAVELSAVYAAAVEQMSPPDPSRPMWRSIGPWTIPNGQTYGASRVNVSGRIATIAVDPSSPAHVLVGAANGGVWESRDRGASWTPRSDYAATLAIGAIAFDPTNPAVVYCGTGEGNWWSFLGQGVLRSADGGASWTTRCTAPFVGQGFYDLVVDHANANHLLAATTAGLYVSNDAGVTWTRTRAARTWSVSISPPTAKSEVLAASTDGVFRSTDGGSTWAAVALPGTPGTFDRLAVAIAPSNAGVAYAWGAKGTTAYLWRRAGGAWTAVAAPPGVSTGQAWYDWFLGVSPDRDTQVYCGAIEVHRGDLSGTTWTWTNISNKGTSGQSIHPDQHAIAFEPGNANTIYVGCDGGLFRSPDRGVTWQHCNNGLVIGEFEYIAQSLGTSRYVIGGLQDNGTARWLGSSTWEHVADGDGGDCDVNRTTPSTVFHSYYGMSPERSTSGGAWGTWTSIRPAIPSGEGSLFYPPFESTATNGNTVALGGDALYVSRNDGTAWVRVAFPAAARASAIHIPDADNVYVGTTDGRLYRTTWNGAAWGAMAALTTPRANAYVGDVLVEAGRTRLWVTHRTVGGGRVYRSDDGGTTWTDRSAGLPGLPMNAVATDPGNRNRVWVAADLGVYQSLDGGATWSDFSNGLPNAYVGDLIFHQHARVLRAGTRNRGVWEIPVDGWMTAPSCGVQFTGSLAGSETRRWFTFRWPATWHVIWTVVPTSVRPGAPQVTWNVQVERAETEYATYWITVQNLTTDAVTFEGRFAILSRY
ncbi:MAG TPA: hypothetical protein VFQ85_09420 [Mycobacteriales bacterium]|jgi:hypothetical protein|nr:hypothetical protein [Mycobacteriales bacterium]